MEGWVLWNDISMYGKKFMIGSTLKERYISPWKTIQKLKDSSLMNVPHLVLTMRRISYPPMHLFFLDLSYIRDK